VEQKALLGLFQAELFVSISTHLLGFFSIYHNCINKKEYALFFNC